MRRRDGMTGGLPGGAGGGVVALPFHAIDEGDEEQGHHNRGCDHPHKHEFPVFMSVGEQVGEISHSCDFLLLGDLR